VPHNDVAVEYFERCGGVMMQRHGNKMQSVPAVVHPHADKSLGELNIYGGSLVPSPECLSLHSAD
jgi:hypothetical protein